MRIISIEPTPSPNTMKINLDQELPFGKSVNYKKDAAATAPEPIKTILQVEGIKGVYHVADFFAVERNARIPWQTILPQIEVIFGKEDQARVNAHIDQGPAFGEVNVQKLQFKGIPIQIKLKTETEEKRLPMPANFLEAFNQSQSVEDNIVLLRKWQDLGTRYGELDQIANEILEELLASYSEERLQSLIKAAKNPEKSDPIQKEKRKLTSEILDHPDWKIRFQAMDQMETPNVTTIPLLAKALHDEKASIRRLAVVYLGMIEDKQVLPYLYEGLKDKSVTVRRTVGDCLSDLGFSEAISEMAQALTDPSKLVRWRAAMYLFEVGDETALQALKAAENDSEFEVALQVKMAIERIENGEEALGSVWKQMTELRNQS